MDCIDKYAKVEDVVHPNTRDNSREKVNKGTEKNDTQKKGNKNRGKWL